MREILFKAKKKSTGEWVEGSLIKIHHSDYRIVEDADLDFAYTNEYLYEGGMTMVEPETISQYIGLCDKNGKKIFEGDIVQRYNEYAEETWRSVVKYGEFNCSCCNGVYGWVFDGGCDIRGYDECEVVGNIFDNADLLKETVIEDEEPSEYVEQDTKCDLCKYNGECESKIEITHSRDTRKHYIRWFNECCKLESEESNGTSKI
jgi:uncharacterized phage protein (TIGR01671 family)